MVSATHENLHCQSCNTATRDQGPELALLSSGSSSTFQDTVSANLPCVRGAFAKKGISQKASTLLLRAWRDGTQKQYKTYLAKWQQYCHSTGHDPFSAPVSVGINFLADLADSVGYSAVNTARSAISSIIVMPDGSTFGKHPLVKRLLKGVFEAKPSLPRYGKMWDLNVLLSHLRQLPDYESISLRQLSGKLAALLAVLTGQRCQTIHALAVGNTDMHLEGEKCTFFIRELLKHSRPGTHLKPILLKGFPGDRKLCVLKCLKAYLVATANLRHDTTALFISSQKPHRPVSKDTVSRWIRGMLIDAGIDTTVYGTHSTRAASTSAAARQGLPADVILESAGWCSNNTFEKFYNLQLENKKSNFGESLLDEFVSQQPE